MSFFDYLLGRKSAGGGGRQIASAELEPVLVNVVLQTAVADMDGNIGVALADPLQLEQGDSYVLEVNGVQYPMICYANYRDRWIGNRLLEGATIDSGEDFLLMSYSGTAWFYTREVGTYTVSLYRERIRSIEPKYLPLFKFTTEVNDTEKLVTEEEAAVLEDIARGRPMVVQVYYHNKDTDNDGTLIGFPTAYMSGGGQLAVGIANPYFGDSVIFAKADIDGSGREVWFSMLASV